MENVMILTTEQLIRLPRGTLFAIIALAVLACFSAGAYLLGEHDMTIDARRVLACFAVLCVIISLSLILWAPRENAGIEHQVVVTGPIDIDEFLDTYEIVDRDNTLFTVIER